MVLRLRGRGRVGRRQLLLRMSNVQYPMTHFEIGYSTLDILHFARRGSDTCHNDSHELAAFGSRSLDVLRTQLHAFDALQPTLSFPQVVQADLEPVNDVLPALGRLRLPVARHR